MRLPHPLAGRVALVTGASSGIGAAIARCLCEDGLRVVLAARRLDRLLALAEELGPDAHAMQVDLRDEASILTLFEQTRARLGGVDVLINNAGLGRRTTLSDGSTEAWREMLEVNVLALTICTREAIRDIRDMRARGVDGHVLHISSMSAHRVPHASGMYSATKYAVRSLTEGLRQELYEQGSGIRVSSVSPGFVETEFAAVYHGDPSAAERTYGQYKVLEPQDISEAASWVLAQPAHCQVHDVLIRPTRQER
ncbi:MAG: SDR family NAD(P)-dependent oxidoreductase [Proteobacteria bacterium]|nr:SDR family NAD(P)-dependent oxidoreductase [Pseudomonadota bacterium]MCP4918983.1 SDR family NAD(P)-dependent oxidoreductase [Pseudomonadota bacterium]